MNWASWETECAFSKTRVDKQHAYPQKQPPRYNPRNPQSSPKDLPTTANITHHMCNLVHHCQFLSGRRLGGNSVANGFFLQLILMFLQHLNQNNLRNCIRNWVKGWRKYVFKLWIEVKLRKFLIIWRILFNWLMFKLKVSRKNKKYFKIVNRTIVLLLLGMLRLKKLIKRVWSKLSKILFRRVKNYLIKDFWN